MINPFAEPSDKVDIDALPSVLSLDTHIEYVVDRLVPARSITMITGATGAGKSTLATAIAGCVSLGLPFAGRGTTRRPVLILDRENSGDVIKDRFERLGIEDDSNIRSWGGWPPIPEEPPHPGCAQIAAWVEKTGPKPLIIIDTFSSFMEGDENSVQDVTLFMQPIKHLCDLGATVIILHHVPKDDEEGCRGSTDILKHVSVRYALFNKKETIINELRLKRKKQRIGVDEEILLHYQEHDGFNADARPFNGIRTATEQLRELLEQHPYSTRTKLYNLASPQGLRGAVDSFLENGIVYGEIECIGNRKHGAVYRLKNTADYPDSPLQ